MNRGLLAKKIRSGQVTCGAFVGLNGGIATAEVLAAAGLDWVLIDLEHGALSESDIGSVVAATGAYGCATLVRVETPDRIRIGKVLDAGAAGIMLPRIQSLREIEEVLPFVSYPPKGCRGVATYNRASAWGAETENLDTANDETLMLVQIETQGALDGVEDIAAHPGVDVLFVGPLDLSYALGAPRDFNSLEFLKALERVVAAGELHRKSVGILASDLATLERRAQEGFTFLAHGSDSTLLMQSAQQTLDIVKSYKS